MVQLDIRIDLTGRAGDAALVVARLATAMDGLARVDVTAVPGSPLRSRGRTSGWSRTRSCVSKPVRGARSCWAAR